MILASTLNVLDQDSSKKFIWAEICFFEKWYSGNKEKKASSGIVKLFKLKYIQGGNGKLS
jgi:hypothetical protein